MHDLLTTSLCSTVVDTRLPGPGSAYMGQDARFLKPVHIGDTVTAHRSVVTIDIARQRIERDAQCLVGGEQAAVRRARVWVPDRDLV